MSLFFHVVFHGFLRSLKFFHHFLSFFFSGHIFTGFFVGHQICFSCIISFVINPHVIHVSISASKIAFLLLLIFSIFFKLVHAVLSLFFYYLIKLVVKLFVTALSSHYFFTLEFQSVLLFQFQFEVKLLKSVGNTFLYFFILHHDKHFRAIPFNFLSTHIFF